MITAKPIMDLNNLTPQWDSIFRTDIHNELQYGESDMFSNIVLDPYFFNDLMGVIILPNTRTYCCAFKTGLVYDVDNDLLAKSYYVSQFSEENSFVMSDVFHYSQHFPCQWITDSPNLTPRVTDFYLGNSHYSSNHADVCAAIQVHHYKRETSTAAIKCQNHDNMFPFCVCSSKIVETEYNYRDLRDVLMTRIYLPIMEPFVSPGYKRNLFSGDMENKKHFKEMFKKFHRTYIKRGAMLYTNVYRLPNLSFNFK